jgi:hypothetical protein
MAFTQNQIEFPKVFITGPSGFIADVDSTGHLLTSGSGGGGGGVTTLNTLTGAITLAAGTGITITPAGNTLTFAATGSGGSFSTITAGTNTTALVIGTAGSLTTSGTGTIAATSLSIASALPNGTTATTQAALSNDTKVATDAYTDAAVAVETTRATTAEGLLVPKTTTVNGHALSANVVVSASDLTTGTLAAAQGGVAASATAGLGGSFAGYDYFPVNGTVSAAVITAANIVDAYQFILKYTQTVTRMAIRVATTFGAASHIGVAIYDSTGARVITTGALDGTNTGATQVVIIGAVTLSPGVYYLGASSDGATTGRLLGWLIDTSIGTYTQFSNTARGNRVVTGASVSAGGVPPATLGALSAQATTQPPLLWIEA